MNEAQKRPRLNPSQVIHRLRAIYCGMTGLCNETELSGSVSVTDDTFQKRYRVAVELRDLLVELVEDFHENQKDAEELAGLLGMRPDGPTTQRD